MLNSVVLDVPEGLTFLHDRCAIYRQVLQHRHDRMTGFVERDIARNFHLTASDLSPSDWSKDGTAKLSDSHGCLPSLWLGAGTFTARRFADPRNPPGRLRFVIRDVIQMPPKPRQC
jgi:hypothetical protein